MWWRWKGGYVVWWKGQQGGGACLGGEAAEHCCPCVFPLRCACTVRLYVQSVYAGTVCVSAHQHAPAQSACGTVKTALGHPVAVAAAVCVLQALQYDRNEGYLELWQLTLLP
jgi:hypothetical protein